MLKSSVALADYLERRKEWGFKGQSRVLVGIILSCHVAWGCSHRGSHAGWQKGFCFYKGVFCGHYFMV